MTKFLVASLLLMSISASAQLATRLDSLMQSTAKANQPGSALLVMIDGKEIYSKGYGLANVNLKSAITSETNFRMASVSKQFTAMGILLLEKGGKLSLDDPLLRFFPEFTGTVGRNVLVRHMLTHSSGLLDYESAMDPNQPKQVLDADILTILKNRDSLYFEPGSQFRYSNSAYCLLALVIERVSGKPYATFVKERIFRPLNMTRSTVYEASQSIPNRAMGYRLDKNDTFTFSDLSITSATKGDGGVYTSLDDYRKWIEALANNTLLDLTTMLIRTGKPISSAPDSYYGAGWFYRQPPDPILFHSGSTCGFNNYVVFIPKKRFLMAYFANRATNKANAEAITHILSEAGYPNVAAILKLDELTQ